MRKDLLIIALGLSLATGPAAADVLAISDEGMNNPVAQLPALPAKGVTMAAVEKKYGTPRDKRPTVGGDSPKQPPITRWDYDGFSVIFEHDRVVDAVIPGAPPRVYNQDQLTPVAASAAPLPPMLPQAEPAPEAEPVFQPAESGIEEPLAEPEAAAAPDATPGEPITPMDSPPAETDPASTYPDGASALTPSEEYPQDEDPPQDAPPTPK
jgi:hypothetical protein